MDFYIPDPTLQNAPIGDELVPCNWIVSKNYAPYQPIDWSNVSELGEGGYGKTYSYQNLVIKIMNSRRRNGFTRPSIHLTWKNRFEADSNEPQEPQTEEEARRGFIEDVMKEAKIQDMIYHKVVATDGKPITAKVYSAGVFLDTKGFYVGVIIMEKITGVPLHILFHRSYNVFTPNFSYLTHSYINNIIDQLSSFSRQMIALGYVHNDISDENVMVEHFDTEHPVIRIIDWGISVPIELERYTISRYLELMPDQSTNLMIMRFNNYINEDSNMSGRKRSKRKSSRRSKRSHRKLSK